MKHQAYPFLLRPQDNDSDSENYKSCSSAQASRFEDQLILGMRNKLAGREFESETN